MQDAKPTSSAPLAIRAAQLKLLCQQATRVPYVVFVIAAFVVYLLWEHQPHAWLLAWAVTVCGLLVARSVLCVGLIRRDEPGPDTDHWIRVLTLFSFANGVAGGSAGWLFFAGTPLSEQALLTMVLFCWCSGAVATASAMPRTFVAFALPFVGPLAAGWFMADVSHGKFISILIVLFLLIQLLTVRDNGRQVVESLQIRLENLGLIEELQREREEANAARERAEAASRSKSRFLAAASHDLRQPLHALSLYSAALSEAATEPRIRDIATNIEASVDSLDSLFEALLDISKLDAGVIAPQMRHVGVQLLLDRLANEFVPQAHARGVALSVDRFEGRIETDPVLVERILRNLLDNAVRYTGSGRIALTAHHSAGQLEIGITDTGMGIPASEQERIFEEFYQLNNSARDPRKGLGLGLATVRRLADLLGYGIELRSAPGVGSTFTLCIPQRVLDDTPMPLPVIPPAAPTMDLAGRIVLVIEDDVRAQSAMQTLLTQWGCTPLVVATPAQAIEAMHAARHAPDMILADYRLGDGITGVQAVRALGGSVGTAPVILITGDTDPQRIRDAQASGYPLLHKPVKAAQLRSAIEKLLSAEAGAGLHPAAS